MDVCDEDIDIPALDKCIVSSANELIFEEEVCVYLRVIRGEKFGKSNPTNVLPNRDSEFFEFVSRGKLCYPSYDLRA